jgi:hypothetical protein
MEESNWGGAYLCWIVETQNEEEEERNNNNNNSNNCCGARHGVGYIVSEVNSGS